MKSIFKENSPQSQKTIYPCLKKSRETNVVVLFTSPKIGTRIYSSDEFLIGNFHQDWSEENFIPFDGEITLSN